MPIEWRPEFETGDKRVDSQHQHLFEYVARLHALVQEVRGGKPLDRRTVDDLLFDLDTYVTIHFAYEEMCMGIRRCPYAAINKEAHGRLEAYYADFQQRVKQDVTVDMLAELESTLSDWLTNHICRVDVALRDVTKPAGQRA